MSNLHILKNELAFQPSSSGTEEYKFTNKQRKQLQHEFKIHLEKYFKNLLGKGSDFTKVVIWDDMLVIKREGFLTEPEKYIATTPKGNNLIKSSRMQVVKEFANDNIPYFEERLEAKLTYFTCDVQPNKDFMTCLLFFDQMLIEQ